MATSKAVMEATIAIWNARDHSAWLTTFSETCEFKGPGGFAGSGPPFTELFWSLWQDAFPDNHITPVAILADDDLCALEAVFEGTHTGTLQAPSSTIPPTGKPVQLEYTIIATIRDGRWQRLALYFDQVALLTQLGLMPAAAAA